jgi:hypothetical protein
MMHTNIAGRSNAPKSVAVIVPALARREINANWANRAAAIN